ncbi:MAG: prepilin-type N-terminal cleavage/methylation domain-containing protein [Cyanobacteriota bacterium]|nr:prepilin-type N-terminal cleavage/methylation domain-containing protein [Cyanobacteriota bacterium]
MYQRSHLRHSTAGFTLAEALVVIIIAGVLAAIAAPGWLTFLDRQRVSAAQDQTLQAMRLAQAKASRENRVWEASFQEEDGRVWWSVHSVDSAAATWQNLTESPELVKIESSTLTSGCKFGQHCIQFADRGTLEDQWLVAQGKTAYQEDETNPIGQITFTTVNREDGPKRCVIVATLLGSLRTDRDEDCL